MFPLLEVAYSMPNPHPKLGGFSSKDIGNALRRPNNPFFVEGEFRSFLFSSSASEIPKVLSNLSTR